MDPGGQGDPDDPAGGSDRHVPSDLELLRAHGDGDREAFGVLVQRHQDRLWAVALRTTGHPQDAEEALQEALIKAMRAVSSFRDEAQVSTWLHRIVVNSCLDLHRRQKVRRADSLDGQGEGQEPTLERTAAPEARSDPAAAAEISERQQLILDGLNRLPAEQRAALVLVDMEAYSVNEAAAILGCRPGTVKSRCARGRTRLARWLRDAGVEGTDPASPPSYSPSNSPAQPFTGKEPVR